MYILPEHCVAFPLQGVPGSYIYMQATRVLNQQNNSLHVALILAFSMLLGFPRHPFPSQSRVFNALRSYSSEGIASRSMRRKGKGSQREQDRFQSTPSIAPSTRQLLEDFLMPESQRIEGKQNSLKSSNSAEYSSGEETIQGTRSTGRLPKARDKGAIKFADLLRDFVTTKGQPLRELALVTTRPPRRSARIRYMEPLPIPAKLNLFDKTPLEEPAAADDSYNNEVFKEIEALEASAYRAKSTHNKFEELIQWTLDGKLWRYPIDNEQDWSEELDTPFHEHIFLNRFARSQVKAKNPAPLEAFMELVCAGLGQNPYLSIKEKRDHIAWFKGYFANKMKDIESAVEEERRTAQAESETRGTKSCL
uniref:Small ribosomal subunit protein mS31 n=1 Tax=Echinococcus granulosus TaxID=6210 RepID=A0A068WKM1_ECHGR|nr:mitochondrial ribosomal protein s31 [Echinococcus granulosus]